MDLPNDMQKLKAELRSVIPTIGSIWHWEPMKSHASARLIVTNVTINEDGEVWIEAARPLGLGRHYRDTSKCWNDLGRWMEAAIMVEPAPGDE